MKQAILLFIFFSSIGFSKSWQAHEDGVWKLGFSSDKDFFLSAGGDGKVRTWWANCNCSLATFSHEKKYQVYDAEFLPEGRVVSTSFDGSIFVWNRETGETIKKITGHTLYAPRVAVSSDGTRFFTASTDGLVIEWNSNTLAEISRIKTRSPVGVVSDQRKGNRIITGSLEGIDLWELNTQKAIRKFTESPYFFTIEVFNDWSFLAAGSISQKAGFKRLNLETGEIVKEYLGAEGAIWQISSSLDGKWVGSSSYKGAVNIWDEETGKLVYSSKTEIPETISLAFIPDSTSILVGDAQGKIHTVRFK